MPDTTTTETTITPPAATTTPAAATTTTATADTPDYKALYEAEQSKLRETSERVTALEREEQARKDAQLSEVEREKKRADEASAEATTLKHEKLANGIAAKHGLSTEARELLTGKTEAELEASAVKIAAIQKQPIQAGSHTQPQNNNAPSIDEQIGEALKKGRTVEAIALKRQKAGYQN